LITNECLVFPYHYKVFSGVPERNGAKKPVSVPIVSPVLGSMASVPPSTPTPVTMLRPAGAILPTAPHQPLCTPLLMFPAVYVVYITHARCGDRAHTTCHPDRSDLSGSKRNAQRVCLAAYPIKVNNKDIIEGRACQHVGAEGHQATEVAHGVGACGPNLFVTC